MCLYRLAGAPQTANLTPPHTINKVTRRKNSDSVTREGIIRFVTYSTVKEIFDKDQRIYK